MKNAPISLRRSLLYIPGDKEAMLAKAAQRGADGIILNLEDAVSDANKELARQMVAWVLGSMDFGAAEVIVRINALSTDVGYRDLLAVMPHAPGAILLPKVNAAEEVRFAAWTIERLEGLHGLPAGQTRIMCMLESAAGILAAPAIAASHPRVAALVFGAADFSEDVNCTITPDQRALLYATSQLICAARSAGIDAIDSPYMALDDAKGLERSVLMARELGFDGKSAIHPKQIAAINAAFSPSPDQVAWAERVIHALQADDGTEAGTAVINGQFLDAPHLARARRLLALASMARARG